MAVKKRIEYKREFLSETGQEDVSYHGSPIYVDVQYNSQEDENIRKEIIAQFSIDCEGSVHKGFDGDSFYFFQVTGTPQTDFKNRKKQIKYNAEVAIKKAGAKSNLENLCDLEEFLIEKGFSEKKVE